MNLAYRFPTIFWNCACLISDAGGTGDEDEEEKDVDETNEIEKVYFNEMEDFTEDDSEDDVEDSYDEDEDCDGYPVEVKVMKDGKKKKKAKTVNYGKIASAIGKIKSAGVIVKTPDINYSTYTFSPDADNNIIRYGLSGITRISEEIIKNIIANRPYSSLNDFLSKVKVNKTQAINLIKSGAFDNFGDRAEIMKEYIDLISDKKKRVTLQNMKMLIDFNLLPETLSFEIKVFNFNKYLKKFKDKDYYRIDEIAFCFYTNNFDVDKLIEDENGWKIKQTTWDSIYKKQMDSVRAFIQANKDKLLESLNNRLFKEQWDKYCLGNLSKWEMDSVSFYEHPHELEKVDNNLYRFDDFFKLTPQPEIETFYYIKGNRIPIYRLNRITGTVLERDKAKKTVTLLTTTGVVTVKIYGGVFAEYDRQISERGADGKKHVIEKSMFTKGNKIIVTGIRQEDSFLAKTYSKTPYHKVEQIIDVMDNGEIIIKSERGT